MKKWHPKVSWLLLCILTYLPFSKAQNDNWLKGLNYGPFQIGYKTLLERDRSRQHIPFQDWEGKMEEITTGEGRPVQIGLWYPSERAQGKALIYADYVHQLAQVVDFSVIDQGRKTWAENWLISMVNDLGANGSFTKDRLNQLMPLQMKAFKEAPMASEKFPLIIFSEGAMPATNSILGEYLASHGYIVASTGAMGPHSSNAEISPNGLLTLAADVHFAIQQVSESAPVAVGQIALIGLGFNASTCMAVQTQNPAIDAVISLEGGILSRFEDDMLKKLPQFEVSAINVPLLVIHAPHPYIDPSIIDYYVHSDRYFLNFKQMSEFHFLNYGLFEHLVPGLLGEAPGDTKKGFEVAAKSCKAFLDGIFKKEEDIKQALLSVKQQENLGDDFLLISKKAALPAPPNMAYLKDLFLKEGLAAIIETYNQLKETNPAPFSDKFYQAFNDWLAWKKDPDFAARKELAQLRVASFPASALAQYYLGYYGKKNGDIALAKAGYLAALECLDQDSALDPETHAAIKKNAQESLMEIDPNFKLSLPNNTETSPSLFANGELSTVNGISFSPDGKTAYTSQYVADRDPRNRQRARLFASFQENGGWSDYQALPFSKEYTDYEAFMAPDGQRLFFTSTRPAPGKSKEDPKDKNIWMVEKEGSDWGEPQYLDVVNQVGSYDGYPAVTKNGTLYFVSDREGGKGDIDIYRSEWVNGKYQPPVNLSSVNSEAKDNDVYVDPEERIMIFSRLGAREMSFDAFDLYISYRENNAWTTPVLFSEVNTPLGDISPCLTPDGQWFLYTIGGRLIFKRAVSTLSALEGKN